MTKDINKEDLTKKLIVKVSAKFAERVVSGHDSMEYATGYADGTKDAMAVLSELVDELIKETEEPDTSNKEINAEDIVASFFRRVS